MAPTIVQIIDGLEAALATIPGLNTSDAVPGQAQTPMGYAGLPAQINPRLTSKRGFQNMEFLVTILVSSAPDAITYQKDLAAYLDASGPKSVISAIESDKTLGGVVDDCTVSGISVQGEIQVGDGMYFGAVFTVSITARGK